MKNKNLTFYCKQKIDHFKLFSRRDNTKYIKILLERN